MCPPTPCKFLALSVSHWDRLGRFDKAVPDLFQEVQPISHAQRLDLLANGTHGPILHFSSASASHTSVLDDCETSIRPVLRCEIIREATDYPQAISPPGDVAADLVATAGQVVEGLSSPERSSIELGHQEQRDIRPLTVAVIAANAEPMDCVLRQHEAVYEGLGAGWNDYTDVLIQR